MNFFDALPIKQFQFTNGGWYERVIGLKEGERVWGLSPTPMPTDAFPAKIAKPEENAIWEMAYPAQKNMEELGALVAEKNRGHFGYRLWLCRNPNRRHIASARKA